MHIISQDDGSVLASGQRYPFRPSKLSCLTLLKKTNNIALAPETSIIRSIFQPQQTLFPQ